MILMNSFPEIPFIISIYVLQNVCSYTLFLSKSVQTIDCGLVYATKSHFGYWYCVPILLCWDCSLSENMGGGWRQQGKHHKFELMRQPLYLIRPHEAITFNQLLHQSKHFQLLFFSKETNRTLDNFQEQPVYVIKPFLFSPHKWPFFFNKQNYLLT
jgi:hypothetical protein